MESVTDLLASLGADLAPYRGSDIKSVTPTSGEGLAQLRADSDEEVKGISFDI